MSAKQRYDAVRPRERVAFGSYRFVIPSLDFQMPKFRCCNGIHEGVAESEPPVDAFDHSECSKEVKSMGISSSGSVPKSVTSTPAVVPSSRCTPSVSKPPSTPSGSFSSERLKSTIMSPATPNSIVPIPPASKVNSFVGLRCSTPPPSSPTSTEKPSTSGLQKEPEKPPPPVRQPSIVTYDDFTFESDEEILFQDEPSDDGAGEEMDTGHSSLEDVEFLATIPAGGGDAAHHGDSDDSFDDDVIMTQGETQSSSTRKRHDMHGQFRGFLKDDGDEFEDEVAALGEELRDQLYRTLKDQFGFNSFRHRQKTAITAILLGHDAFVLMPTGAGKSLCYQLPAVLSTGVTVVVSPLKSLIEDQRSKMRDLGIACEALTSDLSDADQTTIYNRLMCSPPDIKLLYVTPEKISASGRLASVFGSLHKRNFLTRFVIDEAHCVSQWGHDFRPDYTKLQSLRRDYAQPRVPIIALTATATPKIVADTRDHLAITNSKLFISSFVRSNLTYEIVPKAAKTFASVIARVKQLYPGRAGIVYCLSRNECEKVCTSLLKAGVSAEAYHAGLSDAKRVQVQHRWLRNNISVICATIAFGMGIDKPDVRFVIHYSLPKSIEGYYQETGRAGRDGNPSYCLLLYSYQDCIRLRKMVEADDSQAPASVRSMHLQNIYQVVSYCENVSVCRRKILVEHFGEVYDAQMCLKSSTPCDVCQRLKQNPGAVKLFDVSDEAMLILSAMAKMRNVTLRYLAELFRGQLVKKDATTAERLGHTSLPFYGRGVGMSEQDALRFLRKMVVEGYIVERLYRTQFESTVAYAELTTKSRQAIAGGPKPKVYLHVTTDNKRKSIVSDLLARSSVSEAKALKENRCLQAMTQLAAEIAEESRLSGPYSVISQEGLEQVAALMPRTNSDLVQVDSMTLSKVERYGARIMAALNPFWKEVDDRDEAEMRLQLEKLKNQEPAAPMPSVPPVEGVSASSSNSGHKFVPRFGRAGSGRGRGGAPRQTPRPRKQTSRGSSQGSSGGTRAKRARASFKAPARGRGAKVGRATTSSLNPMLFPV
ncbi:hypothetical protein Q1695_015649 [Nippostrongylus brasiliensis]|nr:hypothetical protein Q1695_015649 [Nippostrongylus brasiliensis]